MKQKTLNTFFKRKPDGDEWEVSKRTRVVDVDDDDDEEEEVILTRIRRSCFVYWN
jgi:hypothetical protein